MQLCTSSIVSHIARRARKARNAFWYLTAGKNSKFSIYKCTSFYIFPTPPLPCWQINIRRALWLLMFEQVIESVITKIFSCLQRHWQGGLLREKRPLWPGKYLRKLNFASGQCYRNQLDGGCSCLYSVFFGYTSIADINALFRVNTLHAKQERQIHTPEDNVSIRKLRT